MKRRLRQILEMAARPGDPWAHGPWPPVLILRGARAGEVCRSCRPGSFDHPAAGNVTTAMSKELLARYARVMSRRQ